MKNNARNAAVEALLHTDEHGGYSNLVIDRVIESFALPSRDAALASGLFYGVLERKITLDYIISQYSSRSVDEMNPVVREILRVAFLQLLFFTRIPDSAAVNEAAESAKAFEKNSAVGFINGVLRSFLRSEKRYKLPKAREDSLSVVYSLPKWLIRHFERDYGKETALNYFKSLVDAPPVYLRVNTFKTNSDELIEILERDEITAQKTLLPGALVTKNQGNLTTSAAFQNGLFHIEDLSSQLACSLLNPKRNSVLMDVCSAPGGKAFTLAEIMDGTGTVFAHDLYPQKIQLIEKGAQRLGLLNIRASVRDAENSREGEQCDYILCDVPCSGLGVLRRKPEIRYKDPIEFRDLPAVQLAILSRSASFLKPGGIMVYSTCTLSKRENSAVVDNFLKSHSEFKEEALKLPDGIKRSIDEPSHMFTMFPHENGTDGFFVAKIRKI